MASHTEARSIAATRPSAQNSQGVSSFQIWPLPKQMRHFHDRLGNQRPDVPHVGHGAFPLGLQCLALPVPPQSGHGASTTNAVTAAMGSVRGSGVFVVIGATTEANGNSYPSTFPATLDMTTSLARRNRSQHVEILSP